MTAPPHSNTGTPPASTGGSIFAHDYPIPVSIVLIVITYLATLALPFRFAWTINDILPFIQAHGNSLNNQTLGTPSHFMIIVLLIPILFFFILEFVVLRSFPPVSRTTKVLFITGIIVSSILIGLISPPWPL